MGMTTIIRYVTGFPKNIKLDSEKFDGIRAQYKLERENKDVWQYNGPLKLNDFNVLEKVLTSDQYFNLNRRDFLNLVRKSIHGNIQLTNPYHDMHGLQVSKILLSTIEMLLDYKEISSCRDAERYIHDQAEKNGLKIPVSFSYPFRYEDLTYDTRTLVFLDDEMKGDINLSKTRGYDDPWAGYTEEGTISINLLGQKRRTDWNSWQGNSLRWIVDPIIRKSILKEKISGIIFTRL